MRRFASTCLFLVAGCASAQPSLQEIRALYGRALHEKEAAFELIRILSKTADDPLETGYLGAAQMLSARNGINPINKFVRFQSGRQLLESAIRQDSRCAELRFLRYCIQTNAPAFLGYRDAIGVDRAAVSEWLKTNGNKGDWGRRAAALLAEPLNQADNPEGR